MCDILFKASRLFADNGRRGLIVRWLLLESSDGFGESFGSPGLCQFFSRSSKYEILFSLSSDSNEELNTLPASSFWFFRAAKMVTLLSLYSDSNDDEYKESSVSSNVIFGMSSEVLSANDTLFLESELSDVIEGVSHGNASMAFDDDGSLLELLFFFSIFLLRILSNVS